MAAITWPSTATKTYLDNALDDPKLARDELAALVDKHNSLVAQLKTRGNTAVDTLADLRTLSGTLLAGSALLLGHTSAGDGGAGEFAWDATLSTADNGGTIIRPTSVGSGSPGRWRRADALITPLMFGNVGDGTTNARTAFASANTAATASGEILVPKGTYRINSAITISANLRFLPGAILKPASGVKITLTGSVNAGLYQIFDRSLGGAVEFGSSRVPEVCVEWWGARGGEGGRTDNNVPIQHAIDAVQSVIAADFSAAPNDQNMGGIVRFQGCIYLTSGRIHTRNKVRLVGTGLWTVVKANAATWGADTEVWLSQNGTGSQFHCRAENMAFDSSFITTVRPIYAPAWQQNCGLRDVFVKNFYSRGLVFDNGYGGSVGFELENVTFTTDRALSDDHFVALDADVEGVFSTGWCNISLRNVQFETGNTNMSGLVEQTGVSARGRIKLSVSAVHSEGVRNTIVLDTDASLYGNVIGAGGNPSTDSVIITAATWTGKIDIAGATRGGANFLLRSLDAAATQIYRDIDASMSGRLVYPHTSTEVLAAAQVTGGGGTPTLESTATGFTAISRISAGFYELTFDLTKLSPGSGSAVRLRIFPASIAGRTHYVDSFTTTYCRIVFKDSTGTNADCSDFAVEAYGRPGI